MKIFYPLLCYFPSQGGGPASTVYWLNKANGLNGATSIVVSTKYELNTDVVDYVRLYSPYNIDVEFVSGNFIPYLKPKCIRKMLQTDIVHFSSLFFSPTLFLVFIALVKRKRIVISPRGELYSSALARNTPVKRIYIRLLKTVQAKLNFHATNAFEADLIKQTFPNAKSITNLPNYIDLPKRSETVKKNQILFLGRINPIKNILELIQAYAKLPAVLSGSFKLIIAGIAKLEYEKSYLCEVKNLIDSLDMNDNIHLIGGVFGSKKEVLYSESYCTVLPSKSENFGNVVLESLCQATPVIVSKNTPWSVLEDVNAGYWVDPTPDSIASALEKLLTLDRVEYKEMQIRARDLAQNSFDVNTNINKWQSFYKNL